MTDVTTKKIDQFFNQFPKQSYQRGDIVLPAGEYSPYFFYVETGCVKMSITSASGKRIVVHTHFPGSCFSLLSLISDEKNRYDFIALLPTTVRLVPKDKLKQFFLSNAEVGVEFQIRILKGLDRMIGRIERHFFLPSYAQVAGLLYYFSRHLSEKTADPDQKMITLKLTHLEIAEWLGLSRENVSIQMKQLEKNKLIAKKGQRIQILSVEKLEKMANPFE